MKSCLCGALTKKGVWEAMHQLAGVNDAFRVKMEEKENIFQSGHKFHKSILDTLGTQWWCSLGED